MTPLLSGTAYITGAGSGIGRTTALCLALHGVTRLALGDLNMDSLKETKQELLANTFGLEILLLDLDVRSEESVQHSIRKTVEVFGRIDYAVNNAGISGPFNPTAETEFSDWSRLLDVNLNGVWRCQREELRQMMNQEVQEIKIGRQVLSSRGTIVNVASILGLLGSSSDTPATAYSSSKHAVMGLTKTDARYYARHDIRINAICPGYIETPLLLNLNAIVREKLLSRIPANRLGTPEEVGNSIVYLMSYLSSYIYGQGLVVDGGMICG